MRPVSRTHIGVLCALFIFGVVAIWYMDLRVQAASGGLGVLDSNFGNSPDTIRHTIAALGVEGRSVYLKQFYVADFLYPLVYATFYSQLFRFLVAKLNPDTPGRTAAGKLWLLPWGALVFDYLENLSIGILLAKYPAGLGIWYGLANVGTVTKFSFSYIAVAMLVLVFVTVQVQRWQKRT